MLFRIFEFTAVASIVLVHFAMLIRFNELSTQLLSRQEEAVSAFEQQADELKARISSAATPPPSMPPLPSFPTPPSTSFEFRSVPVASPSKAAPQTPEQPRSVRGERKATPRYPNSYWQEKAKQQLAQARREQAETTAAKDPESTLPKRPQLLGGE